MTLHTKGTLARWLVAVAIFVGLAACGHPSGGPPAATDSSNLDEGPPRPPGPPAVPSTPSTVVATDPNLQTWWHANGELNRTTPVADGNVRRSTVYDVKVAVASAPDTSFDSFVYMSVPRGGRDKWGYDTDDGAEFAKAADLTMSWSSFVYGADTWVEVSVKDGTTLSSVDDVVIRPTTLAFQKVLLGPTTVRILVPYSSTGYRFSVELAGELMTSYRTPDGQLTTVPDGNAPVHIEPRNAMLVFAEPVLSAADSARLVPTESSGSIAYPAEGEVSDLDTVTTEIIFFQPGTYFMPWNYHAYLPPNVRWVYLAPGAFVKGAFEFREGPAAFKVTGLGVLSGEKYVYEPDRLNGYQHRAPGTTDCHGSCIKMLQFASGPTPQTLDFEGVTLSEPPYHSFVVYGNESTFQMNVSRTKQVGAWYWQTDGIEIYDGSTMQDGFIHSNDDVLKLYHSNLDIHDMVVWKSENGPVVQLGWVPRTFSNVHVKDVSVIHNRMSWSGTHNSCIVNSAKDYQDPTSNTLADPTMLVKDLLLENLRSEGMNLCAARLYALSSWQNIQVKNLWIESWNGLDVGSQASVFQALTNAAGTPVTIGNATTDALGLELENYVVGNQRIGKTEDNWRSEQPGRLDFDVSLWDDWNAW